MSIRRGTEHVEGHLMGKATFLPDRARRADEGCQLVRRVRQIHQGRRGKVWTEQRDTGWGSRNKG